ncbi:MAG TPA: 23S rRNA (guanine(745)-N(1))-methyltransferase [Ktedonobacter sp.]|nr:23S rRNA (guanine(745)-N(1))-methyltransferase [Ktedonobacter sp.]
MLTCPICHTPLKRNNTIFECSQHHTFDIAKEGYVNLVTRKLSTSVGDTKEMLQARRSFLNAGLYRPLSDALNAHVVNDLPQVQPHHADGEATLLDVGCGEGYYLGQLQSFLKEQRVDKNIIFFGLDISKEAIRIAARRYKNIQFMVADLKERLVFADSSLHLLLNIFAPRNIAEFARVLVPNGIVIVVIPGTQHLRQLRETLPLLNIQENKAQHVEEQFAPYFKHLTTSSINYTLRLTQQEAEQVVMMTPNYWHLSNEIRQRLKVIQGMETEVAFVMLIFQKR